MNEPETLNTALLKSLFDQLVRMSGRQDAAAARLGISRQRVGQLCSANPEHARDLPTWEQVWTLEQSLGRSIVFQALADAINPPEGDRHACPIKESHDVVAAAAAIPPLAVAVERGEPGADAEYQAGLERLAKETIEAEAAGKVHRLAVAK